jgi:DNA (cytosine-5)-methyltransferase 1
MNGTPSRPRALDICAGAGGLSRGLQLAGFDAYGLELDPDACDTHRRHVGPCKRADVTTYHPRVRFPLVAGGIPCQPFSMAGEREGLDDPRYLLPAFLRVAREAHAEAVMIENVRGLVQMPRAFRVVLDAVEAEYHTTWTVLDAADYGVPQHRDRLFIVGFRDPAARARFRWPMPTHAPPGSLFGLPYVTVRQALSLPPVPHRRGLKDGAKPGSPQGMRFLDVDAPSFAVGGHSFDLLDCPSPCVTASEQKSAMNGTQPMSRRRRASESLSDALGTLDRPAPTVKTRVDEGRDRHRPSRRPMAELQASIEEAGLADRPATTVQADPRLAVAGHHDRQQNGAVRLTPEQCAILQGFPAGWQWTGNKGSQHRQIGNAVPPALAEAVGRSVYDALAWKAD